MAWHYYLAIHFAHFQGSNLPPLKVHSQRNVREYGRHPQARDLGRATSQAQPNSPLETWGRGRMPLENPPQCALDPLLGACQGPAVCSCKRHEIV